jgi:hypothetical protein
MLWDPDPGISDFHMYMGHVPGYRLEGEADANLS